MDDAKITQLRQTGGLQTWLWVWCIGFAVALGVTLGNIIPASHVTWDGDAPFNVSMFMVGLFLGFFAAIPVMVLFRMLRRILITQHIPYLTRAAETPPAKDSASNA